MSVIITIQGTPIEFPSTGESPNWAPAVIEFAQATEDALNAAVGLADIPPTVIPLPNTTVGFIPVTDLEFSNSIVRAGYITYAIIRKSTTTTLTEAGNIVVVYNGSVWTLTRDYVGDADCQFDITSGGNITINIPNAISGTYDSANSNISFSATAVLQS